MRQQRRPVHINWSGSGLLPRPEVSSYDINIKGCGLISATEWTPAHLCVHSVRVPLYSSVFFFFFNLLRLATDSMFALLHLRRRIVTRRIIRRCTHICLRIANSTEQYEKQYSFNSFSSPQNPPKNRDSSQKLTNKCTGNSRPIKNIYFSKIISSRIITTTNYNSIW